jgi:TetR/AcrR family transcriptional repressor of mexJK operon
MYDTLRYWEIKIAGQRRPIGESYMTGTVLASPATEAQPGGSDRRERRRTAILAAARKLFLERGYDAVSVSEIVRESGGSLSTLYDLFASKEGILVAVVGENHRDRMVAAQALCGDTSSSPRELLAMLVRILQTDMFRPDRIGILRILMAESMRNPQIAKLLDESTNLPFDAMLIDLFRRWNEQGKATIDRPEIAADLLIGMLIHRPLRHAAKGVDPCDQSAMATAAVSMFVHHYQLA